MRPNKYTAQTIRTRQVADGDHYDYSQRQKLERNTNNGSTMNLHFTRQLPSCKIITKVQAKHECTNSIHELRNRYHYYHREIMRVVQMASKRKSMCRKSWNPAPSEYEQRRKATKYKRIVVPTRYEKQRLVK
jgi:hypothetical protein